LRASKTTNDTEIEDYIDKFTRVWSSTDAKKYEPKLSKTDSTGIESSKILPSGAESTNRQLFVVTGH
jgi:hypothetical protein